MFPIRFFAVYIKRIADPKDTVRTYPTSPPALPEYETGSIYKLPLYLYLRSPAFSSNISAIPSHLCYSPLVFASFLLVPTRLLKLGVVFHQVPRIKPSPNSRETGLAAKPLPRRQTLCCISEHRTCLHMLIPTGLPPGLASLVENDVPFR